MKMSGPKTIKLPFIFSNRRKDKKLWYIILRNGYIIPLSEAESKGLVKREKMQIVQDEWTEKVTIIRQEEIKGFIKYTRSGKIFYNLDEIMRLYGVE
jgi:hypothetical protein